MLSEFAMTLVLDKLAFGLPGAEPRIGGSRCGDPITERQRFMAAMYL